MLKKLLKYDMQWVWKIWWILIPSVLGVGFFDALLLRFVIVQFSSEEPTMPVLAVLALFALIFSIFILVGSTMLTFALVHIRFYTHLFTDQGYLTFTLPVKRRDILLSKAINALFWTAMHAVLLVIVVLFFVTFAPPPEDAGLLSLFLYDRFAELLSLLWTQFGGFLILYAVLALVLLALLECFSISLCFFCITFASTVVKKAKLLLAVGIYYGATSVISFFSSIFGTFGSVIFGEGLVELLTGKVSAMQHLSITVLLILACVIVAAIASVFYFITRNILERKLNLA